MRTLKQFMLFAALLGAFAFSSCSSDDDGGNPGDVTAGSGTISAKIDGNSFTSLEMTSIATKVNAGGQSTLVIQGNTQSQAFQPSQQQQKESEGPKEPIPAGFLVCLQTHHGIHRALW